MNFIDKALAVVGLKRKGISSGVSSIDALAIYQSSSAGAKVGLDQNTGWVYACVRAIAEELANMELRLFKMVKGKPEEVLDHDVLRLLADVNPHQSSYELKYLSGQHLELTGNAYWLLEGVKATGGKPTAIYILNPKDVQVIKAPYPDFIKGYKYTNGSQTQEFTPEQILHFKYPNPSDPYIGLGTIQAILEWIMSDDFSTEYNKMFFQNGARPGGLLKFDALISPEQQEVMRRSFEQIYKGVENSHKTAILPKGVTYETVGATQSEMDFVETQKLMRDKILAGFRVPKTALGLTEDVNRANAEATNYVFALRTIKPKMQLIVSYLNEFLLPLYGEGLFFDFVDPVPENRELKVAELQAAMAGQSTMSVNEARADYFGLPPIDNGDTVMTTFNLIPLGAPEKKSVVEAKPSKKNYLPRAKKHGEKVSDLSDIIAKAATEIVKDQPITKEQTDEAAWKTFVARVTPYEKLHKEAVIKMNNRQKDEVLSNLSSALKGKAVDKKKLFDKEKWVGIMIGLHNPISTDLFEKEAGATQEILDGEAYELTPAARKAIKKSTELMAGSYNDTTLDLLGKKLTAAQEAGSSIDQLKDVVNEIYDYSNDVRSLQVARTETFRIGNAATHEVWKESGVVKTVRWYTSVDERVCPYCDPLNGKTVGVESNFFDKGDTVVGNDGKELSLDYDDVAYPPLHVDCRCYIRPETIELGAKPSATKGDDTLSELEKTIAQYE